MRWASKCWGVYLLFVLLQFSFKCYTCTNSTWYNDILHCFKSAEKQQRTPSSPPGPGTPFLSQDHWCQKCLLCSSGISCKHKQICGNLSGHFTFYANRAADLPEGSVPSGRRESFLTGFLRPHLLEVPRLVPFRWHLGGFPYFAVPNMAMNCLPHLLFVTRANTGRLKF